AGLALAAHRQEKLRDFWGQKWALAKLRLGRRGEFGDGGNGIGHLVGFGRGRLLVRGPRKRIISGLSIVGGEGRRGRTLSRSRRGCRRGIFATDRIHEFLDLIARQRPGEEG